MNAFDRRGACPGLSAPMTTGDGLLVRFSPLDSVTLADLRAICAAARRYGNGTIEITARGSLQVRGLSARSAPEFARAVDELGIAASEDLSVIANPLPDSPGSIIDPRPISCRVRQAAAQESLALSAKVSVIIDGGGWMHLDALPADVRILAIGPAEKPLLHLSVGGDAASATALGAIAPAAASAVVIALLGAIAAQGSQARAADVVRTAGVQSLRSLLAKYLQRAPAAPMRAPAETIGSHRLRDGSIALGVALAFGHVHSDALVALARAAGTYGAHSVRLAPARALLLLGVAAENTAALIDAAARLGFIVDADDPRRRIVACPGKPACASGLIAARALAADLAESWVHTPGATSPGIPPTSASRLIHISGCAKGCAHPGTAALTVVGTERGCGIVHHGSARETPRHYVDPASLVAEIENIASQIKKVVDA